MWGLAPCSGSGLNLSEAMNHIFLWFSTKYFRLGVWRDFQDKVRMLEPEAFDSLVNTLSAVMIINTTACLCEWMTCLVGRRVRSPALQFRNLWEAAWWEWTPCQDYTDLPVLGGTLYVSFQRLTRNGKIWDQTLLLGQTLSFDHFITLGKLETTNLSCLIMDLQGTCDSCCYQNNT